MCRLLILSIHSIDLFIYFCFKNIAVKQGVLLSLLLQIVTSPVFFIREKTTS